MDVKERKADFKSQLEELREEASLLISNIDSALSHLDEVQTEADIKSFDEKYNVERGLNHIEIF